VTVVDVERMAKRHSVLAVDDDPSILDLITDVLTEEGYRVLPAQNGAEALHILEGDHPCVVLLDMRMPTLDGWGFASAMRDRGLKCPVVVVTAAENARAWAEEIGADAYLSKPFHLTDLLDVVERFCPHKGEDRSGPGLPAYH